MADNIGTITVAIEAQTEDLKKGLASAEKAVKDSAKKMEQATDGLAEKAEKSWTEFASKLGVIQQVAGIAEQAVNALAEAMVILGDDSKTAGEKYNAILDSIRDSGIPVLSQAVSIGRTMTDVFDGTAKELAELNEELERQQKIQEKIDLVLNMAKYQKSLKDILSDEQLRTKNLKKQEESLTVAQDAFKLQERALRRKFEAELEGMKASSRESAKDFDKRRANARELHEQIIEELRKQAKFADEKTRKQWHDGLVAKRQELAKKAEMEEEARLAKEKADTESAKRVAEKTMKLENQLAIMRAKQEGDEEKARTLAIEARYKAMKVGATKAQQAIINQMQAIEMASVGGSGVVSAGGGGGRGGTATFSTAIGGFTVGSGAMERKKQTGLLTRIANATEKISTQTSGSGILPPR